MPTAEVTAWSPPKMLVQWESGGDAGGEMGRVKMTPETGLLSERKGRPGARWGRGRVRWGWSGMCKVLRPAGMRSRTPLFISVVVVKSGPEIFRPSRLEHTSESSG